MRTAQAHLRAIGRRLAQGDTHIDSASRNGELLSVVIDHRVGCEDLHTLDYDRAWVDRERRRAASTVERCGNRYLRLTCNRLGVDGEGRRALPCRNGHRRGHRRHIRVAATELHLQAARWAQARSAPPCPCWGCPRQPCSGQAVSDSNAGGFTVSVRLTTGVAQPRRDHRLRLAGNHGRVFDPEACCALSCRHSVTDAGTDATFGGCLLLSCNLQATCRGGCVQRPPCPCWGCPRQPCSGQA
jgi:hypothetical protein